VIVGAVPIALACSSLPGQTTDWNAVDRALGRQGAAQPGGVQRYSFPRSDLRVVVGTTTLRPALALGSWVAFKATTNGQAIAMGDLVLTDDEVPAVMSALQAGGVEQTALHNHVLNETPHVMYMHIMGRGEPGTIAKTIHDALATSHTPLAAPATAPPPALDIDTAAIAKALGHSGKANGGVYQVSIPRPEKIQDHGMEVPPSMGVATAINIQGTGSGRAVATGDFVLLASEVNPAIRALRSHNIVVTGLHSHLLSESPRLLFMHFWADDELAKVTSGLRAAIDVIGGSK
jgi:hypothetical protein